MTNLAIAVADLAGVSLQCIVAGVAPVPDSTCP